ILNLRRFPSRDHSVKSASGWRLELSSAPHEFNELRVPSAMRKRVIHLAVVQPEKPEVGVAQPRGILENRVEYRLYIRRRFADDLQNSRSGSLTLEGFLGLVEQAHVFDRDYRLVGESLEKRDPLIVEAVGPVPAQRYRADCLPGPQHRNRHLAARVQRLYHLTRPFRHR